MFRNGHNKKDATFNKHHKVSYHLSCKLQRHFWQEILTIKVMKCPPNSDPNPNLVSR